MYMMFKHLHLTFIAISVILFVVRFIWRLRNSPKLQQKWVKVVPHVNDTLLLISAIMLMMQINQYPFQTPWVTDKLIGLIGYILAGLVALKATTKVWQIAGFVVAIGWLGFLFHVALSKQSLIFG
ncbi:Uncharacterized membrane protein SirB2 [Pseudidiomarina planktonica]|uniref:Uncharacterized membrane protein SirB2 n=2 Tax=Pseudidiomarina planktonica TaxID=1323738 RepID=A0A1Y6ES16_9GAMM|nr:SirB2 family protein [Pseudidiomarina planktonica]RUO65626.1 invasion protein [Pseudidiomarina planktonica]SMQ63991.1 Uncharacterized membrane protein SirB2 [Pseudidiomarina planktonica]